MLYLWTLKNSKTSDHHRLWLNLTYKVNLNKSDKYVALSNLGKIKKSHTKIINLEY